MIKIIISFLEVLCLIFTIVFAVLWIINPKGTYEPLLALCTAITLVLDFVRRIMRSSNLRVFVSVGSTYTKIQEEYIKAFEIFLKLSSCEKLMVGRDSPTARQPILQVRNLMKKADAVVILAFTRYIVTAAIEKPGADRPNHKSIDIKHEKYPTVWNQIEAAIAFGLKRPLFIIIEDGIKQEAMLKDRHEFKTIATAIDPKFFDSVEFKGIFNDFIKIARKRSWFRL